MVGPSPCLCLHTSVTMCTYARADSTHLSACTHTAATPLFSLRFAMPCHNAHACCLNTGTLPSITLSFSPSTACILLPINIPSLLVSPFSHSFISAGKPQGGTCLYTSTHTHRGFWFPWRYLHVSTETKGSLAQWRQVYNPWLLSFSLPVSLPSLFHVHGNAPPPSPFFSLLNCSTRMYRYSCTNIMKYQLVFQNKIYIL